MSRIEVAKDEGSNIPRTKNDAGEVRANDIEEDASLEEGLIVQLATHTRRIPLFFKQHFRAFVLGKKGISPISS